MSNLAGKDTHSPIIHTDSPTLDQTKPDPDIPSHPTRHAPPQENNDEVEGIKDDEEGIDRDEVLIDDEEDDDILDEEEEKKTELR